jgi:hypothetical protein
LNDGFILKAIGDRFFGENVFLLRALGRIEIGIPYKAESTPAANNHLPGMWIGGQVPAVGSRE